MKICNKCNSMMQDDALFCAECGAKYEKQTVTQEQPIAVTVPFEPAAQPEHSHPVPPVQPNYTYNAVNTHTLAQPSAAIKLIMDTLKSPLFIAAAVMFIIAVIFQVVSTVVGLGADGYRSTTEYTLINICFLDVYNIGTTVNNDTFNVIELIFTAVKCLVHVPFIVLIIGMLISAVSAFKKNGVIGTTGFTLTKVGTIMNLAIGVLVVIIPMIFILIYVFGEHDDYMYTAYLRLFWINIINGVFYLAIFAVFNALILSKVSKFKFTIKTGKPAKKPSFLLGAIFSGLSFYHVLSISGFLSSLIADIWRYDELGVDFSDLDNLGELGEEVIRTLTVDITSIVFELCLTVGFMLLAVWVFKYISKITIQSQLN